ncbi:fungal-specific transcription factor domain-containing protein [Bisporella sp. PMI_857]|nr:fungal-specific transcription factor domain-containing protein [Bisporella sp. PMI_857]
MVRSSIACARCRRSKIRCVNSGTNSTCKSCQQSNRECTYPSPGTTATPKQRPEVATIKQEDGEPKKRARKAEDTGRRNSARNEDPLESQILTRKVWEEVYEIYKLHFSTEMPFLHPPTFKNRMKQAAYPRDASVATTDLNESRVLLLGVLTLTARFHPELVAHHAQPGKPTIPLDASEYYATALKVAFGPTGLNLTTPSLDGIQALLMLGLYEWGQTRGLSAWVYVGIAMRLAQSMGIAYEDDPDNAYFPPSMASRKHGVKPPPKELTIEKEVRRRTLWSCFVMDRLLSAGKYRPNMIAVDRLRVHLPCLDDQFLFGEINIDPSYLHASWLESDTARRSASDNGVLSTYIRLVEIFGRFSEWSYAGGRRTETRPPWDSSTQFFKLRKELEEFYRVLPSHLTFTEANLSAHIEKRSATAYTSMHTLYSLCLIMLHREYIPFIPLRCEKPCGPLDEPTFPKTKYAIPEGFWEESAEEMCKAAKDIVEIVRTCQDNNVLPESPQIGFAIYQAAFVGVYIIHFPHMDTGGFITHFGDGGHINGNTQGQTFDSVTVKILKSMIPRLKMAKSYCKTLAKMHEVFRDLKQSYNTRFKLGRYVGGGLEQYKTLEKELKEFGSLEDNDKNAHSDGSEAEPGHRSRASTNEIGHGSLNGEQAQGNEAPTMRRSGAWAAINASIPPIDSDERIKYQGPYTYPQVAFQQSPGQSSNPPSLISPSNGDSTPGVASPYQQNQPFQPQHMSGYAPVMQQQAMLPPGSQAQTQGWSDDQNEQWIGGYEQISMASANFDNFIQDDSQKGWNMSAGLLGARTDFFNFVNEQLPPTTPSY